MVYLIISKSERFVLYPIVENRQNIHSIGEKQSIETLMLVVTIHSLTTGSPIYRPAWEWTVYSIEGRLAMPQQ